MVKQPFTNSGIEQKKQELYTLPGALQKRQTAEIRTNFKGWMVDNFKLNDSQVAFVNQLDPELVKSINLELADCIEARLPIMIILPTDNPWGSKFMQKEEGIKYLQTDQGMQMYGRLRIRIGYRQ